jgi:hypothetical protein
MQVCERSCFLEEGVTRLGEGVGRRGRAEEMKRLRSGNWDWGVGIGRLDLG